MLLDNEMTESDSALLAKLSESYGMDGVLTTLAVIADVDMNNRILSQELKLFVSELQDRIQPCQECKGVGFSPIGEYVAYKGNPDIPCIQCTAGPWVAIEVKDDEPGIGIYQTVRTGKYGPYQHRIARVVDWETEGKANAALIAAAPDGYELALHVLAMADDAYLTGHPEWDTIVLQARNLINKAKGS